MNLTRFFRLQSNNVVMTCHNYDTATGWWRTGCPRWHLLRDSSLTQHEVSIYLMSNPKDMQGHARYVCPWNLYFPASVTISDSELDLPMKQVGRKEWLTIVYYCLSWYEFLLRMMTMMAREVQCFCSELSISLKSRCILLKRPVRQEMESQKRWRQGLRSIPAWSSEGSF